MAEVADLHLPDDDVSKAPDEEVIETLTSVPYWSSFFDHDESNPYDYYPDIDSFSPRPSDFDHYSLHAQTILDGDGIDEVEAGVELVASDGSDSDSVTDLNYFNRQDHQVNLVFNMFERFNDDTHIIEYGNSSFPNRFDDDDDDDPNFRVIDENDEMGLNYLELGSDIDREIRDETDDNGGFMIEEFEGECYVSRLIELGESGESSVVHPPVEPFRDGLRLARIDSDSDEEEEGDVGIEIHSGDDDGFDDDTQDELDPPLCWDCLRLDDHRETNEEFEWEEVDERQNEREGLNMVIDSDERSSISTELHSEEVGDDGEPTMRTLEWEVILAVNNLDRNSELEQDPDQDGYIYPAEYELLFGQFTEHESSLIGSPPAAKSVIDNLPSILITQDDIENKNAICAVCKDDIDIKEQVKKLPCTHYYHGDCILPWLRIRNTCPVCRYELPTDDPDYERMKTQRANHNNISDNNQVRNDFEMFP